MPEIDPTLFDPHMDFELNLALTTTVADYSAALGLLEQHARQNDPERQEALRRNIRELPDYQKIEEITGDGFLAKYGFDELLMRGIGTDDDEQSVSTRDYQKAQSTVSSSELTLSTFVAAYAGTTFEKARDFFDAEEEARETAWSGTWQKLHSIISSMEGTSLVDVANLFDNLIRWQYADTYDPQSLTRGLENSDDQAALTFYQVFADHLSRAITRRTEDGWTGL